jgi:hypothetical protein
MTKTWWLPRVLCLLSLAALAGCYKSETAVVLRGERSPMTGSFDCHYADRDGGFTATMREESEGTEATAGYRYLDTDGRSYRLARLPSGLHLVQTDRDGGGFEYGFLDFPTADTFVVLQDDTAGHWRQIRARLTRAGLHYQRSGDVVSLRGGRDGLRTFFASHDRRLLRESSRCTRRQLQ